MKKNFVFMMAVTALVVVLSWRGPVRAYEVTGDVTSGWSSEGGDLWYDVLKETATSTAGQYDDAGDNPHGVLVRPPTTKSLPNPLSPTNHNWIEVDYILVTGRGGQRVLYSVGELDPRFGNEAVTLTLNRNKRDYDLAGAGRAVKMVGTIEVVHAFTNIKSVPNDARPYSPMLVVSGAGITPQTYDLADLQAMGQVTFDASSSKTNTYGIWTGPRLLDVLNASGVDTKNMNSYIIVQGADGYATLLSMYEVTHNAGACPLASECPLPLLAISGCFPDTGKCSINCGSSCSKGENGFVRTALPKDLAAGRWVSNTAQIIVFKLDRK
jgi:hypothetical protein